MSATRVWGLGLRGFGFGGLGFRAQGLGFRTIVPGVDDRGTLCLSFKAQQADSPCGDLGILLC